MPLLEDILCTAYTLVKASTPLMQTSIGQTHSLRVHCAGHRPCRHTIPQWETREVSSLKLGAPASVLEELNLSGKSEHGGSWVGPQEA